MKYSGLFRTSVYKIALNYLLVPSLSLNAWLDFNKLAVNQRGIQRNLDGPYTYCKTGIPREDGGKWSPWDGVR